MKHFRLVLRAARFVSTGCIAAALFGPLVSPAWAQNSGAAPGAAPVSSVSRNLYAAGGQVRPGASVEGDFSAAGGRVIVDHPVKGDVTLAGGSVDLRAPVGDDVRVVGGDVNVDSSVGGELFATGGNVTVGSAARVGHGARLYGGSVTLDGKVDGRLDVGAQKITINGEVAGDARLAGDQIELGPTARINGALNYQSGTELKLAEGATVAGAITREEGSGERRRERTGRDWQAQGNTLPWAGSVFTFFALLAFGAVFLLVFPVFAARASDTVRTSPLLALAVGFGALVAVPVLAVLLFITLLGIPLGVVVMALYPVLLLAGYVVGVLFIARLAQAALRKQAPSSFAGGMGFFALALLLLMLIGRLPFVGGLAVGVITVLGIGACVLEAHRRRRPEAGAKAAFTRPPPLPGGATSG